LKNAHIDSFLKSVASKAGDNFSSIMKFNRILFLCIVCLEAQTQACPKITFQTSTTEANTGQGSQTMNMTTGIKSIKCSDGSTSTSALLSFTYDDGRGPQEGVCIRF
jgi:hypothetical protein